MSTTPEHPNLYQRLADIAGTIHVDKNGRMSDAGKYDFIKHEDLIDALKAILLANGIAVLPVDQELLEANEYKTAAGKLGRHVRIKSTYLVVDVWDPEVNFTIKGLGEAADTQDKGTQKAGTSAEKYLYMRLLKVTEGGGMDTDGIAVEEGVVADIAARPAVGVQPIPQAGFSAPNAAELALLKVLAATLAVPWTDVVLKARLERFGFLETRLALIKAGATEAPIPPPPSSDGVPRPPDPDDVPRPPEPAVES